MQNCKIVTHTNKCVLLKKENEKGNDNNLKMCVDMEHVVTLSNCIFKI